MPTVSLQIKMSLCREFPLVPRLFTFHQTHYRSHRGRFYWSNDPTNSVKALKGESPESHRNFMGVQSRLLFSTSAKMGRSMEITWWVREGNV